MATQDKTNDTHASGTSKKDTSVATLAMPTTDGPEKHQPYMQNRELSWLMFDQRCLEQGADKTVPLIERLQFVSIFQSNLQEFFMVRVGSLTDLSLLQSDVRENKTHMTPDEQLDAIYDRCHQLYPFAERIYDDITQELTTHGVRRLHVEELSKKQSDFLHAYMVRNVLPFLSPQIVNARHPFPHLANGELYTIVRLQDKSPKKKSEMTKEERAELKRKRKEAKNLGAEGVVLGIVPMPRKAKRLIKLPSEKGKFDFILLEDAMEDMVDQIYSMYSVKSANTICVTRNADLDATEAADETEGSDAASVMDTDYREYMKKILKKRSRLAPVRLESHYKLSSTVSAFLQQRLNLDTNQLFVTHIPMNLDYAFGLAGMLPESLRNQLISTPFAPAWPASLRHDRPIMDQIEHHEVLLSYPYDSMDPFVRMLQEASQDPSVVSIKITLYRLANESRLAEALIAAAQAGKEVTALFELRARFDENNNIRWSQRFEEAGANVIYGFHDLKVHSKICCITRNTNKGIEYITQLGTGNYNEKTAKLYTDFCFITKDPQIGKDAVRFFRNMGMESVSRDYETLWVAPLQIKQNIVSGIDDQIQLAKAGKPCGLFFKTNSVTDKEIIFKLSEASNAGVPITLLVRGICCILPGVPGYTENIRVVSIVGRLLEHSRIYMFGPKDDHRIYLASADLMTRNMDKRVEIAWPVTNPNIMAKVEHFIKVCLSDTAKLRELKPDGTYTELRHFAHDENGKKTVPFNAQETLIKEAAQESEEAARLEDDSEASHYEQLRMRANSGTNATKDLQAVYREALQHELHDDSSNEDIVNIATKVFTQVETERAKKESIKPAVHVIDDGNGAEAAPKQADTADVQANAQTASAQAANAATNGQTASASTNPQATSAAANSQASGAAPNAQTSTPANAQANNAPANANNKPQPQAITVQAGNGSQEHHGFWWKLFHLFSK